MVINKVAILNCVGGDTLTVEEQSDKHGVEIGINDRVHVALSYEAWWELMSLSMWLSVCPETKVETAKVGEDAA